MFLETSAKTAYNVVESFNLSAQCILNNIEKNGVDPTVNSNMRFNNNNVSPGGINPGVGGNEKKGGCC